jgi:GR25 family glycosyltransferase involved in LPS biosynthesis
MKAFIIYLPSRPHSVVHASYMQETLKGHGIEAELFEGVDGDTAVVQASKAGRVLYPYSIKNRELSREELRKFIRPSMWEEFQHQHYFKVIERRRIPESEGGKLSRPGVIGCFYSHFLLWERCHSLQEPIMIFEDDVKFYRGYTPVGFRGVLILSLGKSSFLNKPYQSYLESPTGLPCAQHWPNFSMPGASGYAITPGAALGLLKHYRGYYYPADNAINQFVCDIQIHNYIMGRNTLPEEGNISMTKSKHWSRNLPEPDGEEDT